MKTQQEQLRRKNRNKILRHLHFYGPTRRGALAADCVIRKSSVTGLVTELLQDGLIIEDPPGGMRSVLSMNLGGAWVVSVSLEGCRLRVARVFLDGRIQDECACSLAGPPAGPEALFEQLDDLVLPLFTKRQHALGLGLAMPGLVDAATGTCLRAVAFPGWRNVPVADLLSKRYACPVVIDHDVRAQLWAEAWFGRLLNTCDNMLFVSLRDGVAAALVTHGQRFSGGHFAAGEIGHVQVGHEGRACRCGRLDCLETYCSFSVFQQLACGHSPVEGVLACAPEQITAIDDACARLAEVMTAVISMLDPQLVLLSTPQPEWTAFLLPRLQELCHARFEGAAPHPLRVLAGPDVSDSTLRGAAALVLDRLWALE